MSEKKKSLFGFTGKTTIDMIWKMYDQGVEDGKKIQGRRDEKTAIIHFAGDEDGERFETLSMKLFALDTLVDMSDKGNRELLSQLFEMWEYIKDGVDLGEDMADCMTVLENKLSEIKLGAPNYADHKRKDGIPFGISARKDSEGSE